mmetsp:Transcript_19902/g.33038  ORF Transcript_19902/g.33038 Transcript_19902/m.33038 type:complete len:384 (+) Transcript_19902:86-1237(+)
MRRSLIPIVLHLLAVIDPVHGGFAAGARKGKKQSTSSISGAGFGSSKQKKKSLPLYTPDDSTAVKKLVNVLVNECECEGIEPGGAVEIGFGGSSNMRGVFAKEALGVGEFVVAVPFPSTLVVSMEEDESITDADRGLSFLNNYLLDHWSEQDDEGNKQQWYYPYLNCLPRNDFCFDPTPDFWTDEEIKALEFPHIVKEALERKEQIRNLAEKEGVDVAQLQFATWLVKSRSFTALKIKPDCGDAQPQKIQSKSVLVPFFDMLNHSSNQPNAELQVIETKVEDESFYAVQATRPIPAGKEITIAYGTTCDSSVELLMNYGLVQNSNQYDAEMLRQGGDNCLNRIEDWSTTLEEDENELKQDSVIGNRRTILAFRSRLKRAIQEM